MQEHVRQQQLQAHLNAGRLEEDFQFKVPPPRRLLVGGLRAEKILLHTDLLQWYLAHGIILSQVHQVIEFQPTSCFKNFIDEMTEIRREADLDPDKALIAESAKLTANSSYGSLLMDKEKHQQIKYLRSKEQATLRVKHPRFRSMTEMSDDLFEMHMQKPRINLDLPVYLGVQILQLAKLALLRFYYDCLDKWCDRKDFEVLFCDTDSIYIAHGGGESWESIIRPEFRDEYISQTMMNHHVQDIDPMDCWFPRKCCSDHEKRDKRRPGLVKLEFSGSSFIGLCSKTYHASASDNTSKYSCKGIQKDKIRENVRDRYMRVLTTGKAEGGRNVGFQLHNKSIWTYAQSRKGLSFYYCKRQVMADGVSTRPLQILLNPWK